MNNTASLLVLVFMAVTFIQSGYDKVFHWKGNLEWLTSHFSNSIIKNNVPASLAMTLALELVSGILCIIGSLELLINGGKTFGYYGAVFSSVTFIFLLLGQRLAKDYDGARTIAIYFVPAVLAVYWLG